MDYTAIVQTPDHSGVGEELTSCSYCSIPWHPDSRGRFHTLPLSAMVHWGSYDIQRRIGMVRRINGTY